MRTRHRLVSRLRHRVTSGLIGCRTEHTWFKRQSCTRTPASDANSVVMVIDDPHAHISTRVVIAPPVAYHDSVPPLPGRMSDIRAYRLVPCRCSRNQMDVRRHTVSSARSWRWAPRHAARSLRWLPAPDAADGRIDGYDTSGRVQDHPVPAPPRSYRRKCERAWLVGRTSHSHPDLKTQPTASTRHSCQRASRIALYEGVLDRLVSRHAHHHGFSSATDASRIVVVPTAAHNQQRRTPSR